VPAGRVSELWMLTLASDSWCLCDGLHETAGRLDLAALMPP
jgi:hypothetical protein